MGFCVSVLRVPFAFSLLCCMKVIKDAVYTGYVAIITVSKKSGDRKEIQEPAISSLHRPHVVSCLHLLCY